MDCKISWTFRAWKTYTSNIAYLKKAWTDKEISNFIISVDNKIAHLSRYPEMGSPRSKKFPNIRSIFVNKRIILIYKFRPLQNEIDLLVFWNTYQNPRKLKVK